MKGKGKQFVPHGRVVQMGFPGGAGYGDPTGRDPAAVRRDLALGYITAEAAARDYGLGPDDIAAVLEISRLGKDIQ